MPAEPAAVPAPVVPETEGRSPFRAPKVVEACTLAWFVVILVLILGAIVAKVTDAPLLTGDAGKTGALVAVVLLFVLLIPAMVWGKVVQNRIRSVTSREGWSATTEGTATATVRSLASLLNAYVAADPKFPAKPLVDAEVRRPGGTARVVVSRAFRRGKKSLISHTYVWVTLPGPLPSLVLWRDIVAGTATPGRDVDIESEAFNRRYRVTRRPGDTRTIDDGTFARYATGLLHPRNAEALLASEKDQIVAGVDGTMLFAITFIDPERIERVADSLLTVARQLPKQVLTDFRR